MYCWPRSARLAMCRWELARWFVQCDALIRLGLPLVAGTAHSHPPLARPRIGFPSPQQGHTQPHSTPDSKLFLEEQSFKAEVWKFVIGGVSATLCISTGMITYRGHGNDLNRFGISVPFFHVDVGRHSARKWFFHCLAVGVGICTLCGS